MKKILKKINNIDINNVNLYLFSKHKYSNDFEVFSTIFNNNQIKEDMKNILKEQIINHIDDENHEIYEYNPIFKDNQIVQRINCDEIEYLNKFINEINLNYEIYNENKLKKDHELWLIAIVIDDGIDKIISFQKIRSKILLKNKTYLLTFGNKIKKFKEPLLQLKETMDCICFLEKNKEWKDQNMYIFNSYYFEMIFGFEKKFKREIISMLENLKNNNEYDMNLLNTNQLYEKVKTNKNHLKKLYVILKNNNFNYLNEENIHKIEEKSRIKFNRPNGKIELKTNEDVRKLLNFLNDDYLEGILSEKTFITSNKRDV